MQTFSSKLICEKLLTTEMCPDNRVYETTFWHAQNKLSNATYSMQSLI